MNIQELEIFCWTKMQAESGELLPDILRRKEQERSAGNGLFYWGVGNSLERKFATLRPGAVELVVFSRMRSAPKKTDLKPRAIALWLNYLDSEGRVQFIPPHVVLTSRASSKSGLKNHHYALVCQSDNPLQYGNYGSIDLSYYRNYDSDSPRIGHSQVTTILERRSTVETLAGAGSCVYEVNLIARLSSPYFVRLVNPIVLSSTEAVELGSIFAQKCNPTEYLKLISQYRTRIARN